MARLRAEGEQAEVASASQRPGAPGQRLQGTHPEVGDQSKHQVGEGFGHGQPGSNLGVQQALDGLLSQGCGSPYELLVTQCHHRHVCQRGLQGSHTLLLCHQAAHGAVHLRNQVELARGQGTGTRGWKEAWLTLDTTRLGVDSRGSGHRGSCPTPATYPSGPVGSHSRPLGWASTGKGAEG